MRIAAWVLSAGLVAALVCPQAVLGESQPDSIAHLVKQLGSIRFAERQAALQSLDEMGTAALDQLRPATQSTDPEIRRRALELVERIEKRSETGRVLAPRRIRLVYADAKLSDAIADLAQKTGVRLEMDASKAAWLQRRITLDTGDVALWDAVELFCRTAGVVDRSLLPQSAGPVKEIRETDLKDQMFKKLVATDVQLTDPQKPTLTIHVTPGSGPVVPTCRSGPLRIRALNNAVPGWGQTPGTTELVCSLDVTPEPGSQWLGIIEVRIDKAIDGCAQELSQVINHETAGGNVYGWGNPMLIRRQMQINFDGYGPAASSTNQIDVRLWAGKKPSVSLKRLQGAIVGQMKTEPQSLIEVADILKASGREFQDKNGTTLQILQVESQKDGVVKVQFQLSGTPDDGGMGMGGRFAKPMIRSAGQFQNLSLRDGKGRPYALLNMENDGGPRFLQNGGMLHTATMYFQVQAGQGEPATLVLTGRRTVWVEAPFVLENVPMP
ncbi:MAG: hypothetical protein K2R98_22520 [Gemmataceae bacterium]|nr:hypothetical protein [Gemmataceae bacterium]